MSLPPFVDLRHTVGTYPAPEGDLKTLLDATLAATHIVFVSPVYWFSIPSPLKTYLDHWSGWMRVPGLPFKEQMAAKSLLLITTSGDRAKAQPMIDSVELCAKFLSMPWGGALWARAGRPVRCRRMRRPWHRPRTFCYQNKSCWRFLHQRQARFHSKPGPINAAGRVASPRPRRRRRPAAGCHPVAQVTPHGAHLGIGRHAQGVLRSMVTTGTPRCSPHCPSEPGPPLSCAGGPAAAVGRGGRQKSSTP